MNLFLFFFVSHEIAFEHPIYVRCFSQCKDIHWKQSRSEKKKSCISTPTSQDIIRGIQSMLCTESNHSNKRTSPGLLTRSTESLTLGSHRRNVGHATATAKSLQSCPTLCDPIPGILQARTLEWAAISFSNAWKWSCSVVSNS